MVNNPIYDEVIIVGVVYDNNFNWYITNKLFWIMNLEKLSKYDYNDYFKDKEIKQIRKDISILSEKNAKIFLNRIDKYKTDIDFLRLKILEKIKHSEKDNVELEEFYPTLMINFDNNILYSQYPEPLGFENYVPDNWKGKYTSFIEYINNENKYWIYKNRNILNY